MDANINDMIKTTVVSARVRLARNIAGVPFPNKLFDAGLAAKVIDDAINSIGELNGYRFFRTSELSETHKLWLVEKELISKELAVAPFGAALISGDESVSVMFHEEDHIREQSFTREFALKDAYAALKKIDDEICLKTDVARDRDFGYLTSCPTNLGLGLRASVMLFLPALTAEKKMERTARYLKERGMTVRGVYGEGSAFDGYMYQISNQSSFKLDAEEIIDAVSATAIDVIKAENQRRETLAKEGLHELTDGAYRAYGILTNAFKISFREALELISRLKLGISVGIIGDIAYSADLDRLITTIKPANLSMRAGKDLTPGERDVYRAEIIKKSIDFKKEG
ncbi:MAG: ATP--guanido phosphotransferase [Clostridiales bacterium]|jgi:protein arginine kinase|nr:ATP--guanido phosphotransferase [Clostridiales bacterium]